MASYKSWLKAARLRTLPLSLSGIIVGSSLAYAENQFNGWIFLLASLTTVGFQVVSNFANDYGDGVKGTDNADRVGPTRALQSGDISPKQMLKAIKIASILTFVLALGLIILAFGKTHFKYVFLFIGFGIASIVAALKYTMGKKAYGYSGYGDVFVFLFFGLLGVCGSYFLYTKSLHYSVFLPSFTIGLLSTAVLNLNNMRDQVSDKKAEKRTLVVKIGNEFAKYYHYYLLGASFLFALWYTAINLEKPSQFLFLGAYVFIFRHFKVVYDNENPEKLDPELKKLALSTFLFALLFALGLMI